MGKKDIIEVEVLDVVPAESIPEDIYQEYERNGFNRDDVPSYETVAGKIAGLKRRSVESVIEIGRSLSTVKTGEHEGSWLFFVEGRCGISHDIATRYMAAAEAVDKYPQLAALASNFTSTALAVIGQRKELPEATVEALAEMAEEGDVNDKEVREVIKASRSNEPKPTKEQKLGFISPPTEVAESQLHQLLNICDQVFGSAVRQSGLKYDVVRKNKKYRSFVASLAKEAGDPATKALQGFLATYWMFFYSASAEATEPEE